MSGTGSSRDVRRLRRWEFVNDQGDDHLLERPRDHGGDSRGRPRRRNLRRARAAARRRRQRLQGPGLESAARHAVVLRRPRPRARRLPLRRRRHRHARGVRQARVGDDDDEAERQATAAATAEGRGARRDRRSAPQPKIEDLLKEGQEIIVQVVKEPLGTKGARLTSHVTMPGRFLVFMPTVDHVGVSRKIESREERAPPARHRPRVPRGARLHRRRHHPHRRGGPPEGRHRQRPRGLPQDLDRDPPEDGIVARAGGASTASRAWSASCCATC